MPPKDRRPMSEIIAEKRRLQQQQSSSAASSQNEVNEVNEDESSNTNNNVDWDNVELEAAWETIQQQQQQSGRATVVVIGFDELMTRSHIAHGGRYPERPNRLSRTMELLRSQKVMVAPASNIRRMIDYNRAPPAEASETAATTTAKSDNNDNNSNQSSLVKVPMLPGRLATKSELHHLLVGNATGDAISTFLFGSAATNATTATTRSDDNDKKDDGNYEELSSPSSSSAQHGQLPPAHLISTDLHIDATSAVCARRAAAISIDAAKGVAENRYAHAFCAVRPPGHHSGPDCCHGFCLCNNVAAAASALLLPSVTTSAAAIAGSPVRRVVIIDIDVHHGDGTQSACDHLNKTLLRSSQQQQCENSCKKEILFISVHRYDKGAFFPGTGHAASVGPFGLNLNLGFDVAAAPSSATAAAAAAVSHPSSSSCASSLPDVFCDSSLRQVTRTFLLPLLRDVVRPDVVLVSCGFDAMEGDPLGGQAVSVDGLGCFFEELGRAGHRVCAVMEGGYNVDIVSNGTLSAVRGLARSLVAGDSCGGDVVDWKCKTPKKIESALQALQLQEQQGEQHGVDTSTVETNCRVPTTVADFQRRNEEWMNATLKNLAATYVKKYEERDTTGIDNNNNTTQAAISKWFTEKFLTE